MFNLQFRQSKNCKHCLLPIAYCLLAPASCLLLASCSIQKQISKSAQQVITDSSLKTAHVGISIYEPATNKYWFNYQGDHYFVPASNTKIPTCYAAMKYLGDSLVGFSVYESPDTLFVRPNGDPTFLHPDFSQQKFFNYLQRNQKTLLWVLNKKDRFDVYGDGWSWNDYQESYMAERSRFPIYGNLVTFENIRSSLHVTPQMFLRSKYFKDPTMQLSWKGSVFSVSRSRDENLFHINNSDKPFTSTQIPFKNDPIWSIQNEALSDTLHRVKNEFWIDLSSKNYTFLSFKTQPTDSVLKPMMHNSDNFFAEQSLLMVSNERLGYMNDEKIIDTLLRTDFKDLPQKPRWVDGSGLSRYNLFSPQDFVFILNKIKNEFGMARIKNILPTGNEGTLEGRFIADSNYIFAKTGALSGVVALSGYLYTKKNKLLIFSVLVNNHNNSSTAGIRKAEEKFIEGIRSEF